MSFICARSRLRRKDVPRKSVLRIRKAGSRRWRLTRRARLINIEKERPRPEKQPRTRSKSANVALTGKMGRPGLCLLAPVDAPKLELIACAFPSQAAHSTGFS